MPSCLLLYYDSRLSAEESCLKHDGGEFVGRKIARPVYSNDLMLCQSPHIIEVGIKHRRGYYLLLSTINSS